MSVDGVTGPGGPPQAGLNSLRAVAPPPPSAAPAHRPAKPTAPPADRDAELLRRAQAGDRAAFGEFVLATQDRLYTLIVRIVGDRDEARELAQEAYLKALGGLSHFRGNAAPYTWLYRIAVNLSVARLRKVRRQRTFSLEQPGQANEMSGSHTLVSPGESAEEFALRRERDRQVIAALGRLDSEYRAVLVMRDIDGMDYQDISDVLSVPLGTVKSRLFRARLALREEINRYLNPPVRKRPAGIVSHGIGGLTI